MDGETAKININTIARVAKVSTSTVSSFINGTEVFPFSPETRRRVKQALRDVHAEALADKMTHHLSGGEKRAVSIATVLSMSPDILVLDEPSANLDPASRRTLISLLRQFTHTKIIATHDLDMVMELCTRCVVMKDGSILADAPVPDIFADRSLLAEASLEQPLSYLLMRQERQRNNSGAF